MCTLDDKSLDSDYGLFVGRVMGIVRSKRIENLCRKIMNLGLLFLETLSSGVITSEEMDWITFHQPEFSRTEEATALRLGRLLDNGFIKLGCRI